MCCPGWGTRWGREQEVGVSHCSNPVSSPLWQPSKRRLVCGEDAALCELGMGPGLRGSEEKAPGMCGRESTLLPFIRLSLCQVLRATSSQILCDRVGLWNKRQLWFV